MITGLIAVALTPFFTLCALQMPTRLLAEYHNECVSFLQLKRRPTDLPARLPRSQDMNYHSWLYYLPIVSYIATHAARKKKHAINPTQRLLMEALSITIIMITLMQYGWTLPGFAMTYFYLSLIAIGFIDANSKLIPDILSVSTLWIGLAAATVEAINTPLPLAIWGAIAGYTGPYLISKLVCLRNNRPDAMGHGDFKMLAMLGVWLGPLNTLNTVVLSSLLFLLYFLGMHCMGRASRHSLIPFGPFLSVAAWAACQSPWFLLSTYLSR